MSLLHRLAAFHDGLTRLGAILSTLCLGGIVLLYCGEVVMRYGLDSPTSWSAAVSVYLLLATVMLMMPHLTSQAEHVSASLIDDMFPAEVSRAIGIAIMIVACLVCAVAAYFSFSELARAWQRGTLTTDTLYIPKWWLLALLVYGLASSSVHFARHVVERAVLGRAARARAGAHG